MIFAGLLCLKALLQQSGEKSLWGILGYIVVFIASFKSLVANIQQEHLKFVGENLRGQFKHFTIKNE